MCKLGTKADTLNLLYGKLKSAMILPQFTFKAADWIKDRRGIMKAFSEIIWNENVIVRSSALNEDMQSGSMAGKFKTMAWDFFMMFCWKQPGMEKRHLMIVISQDLI